MLSRRPLWRTIPSLSSERLEVERQLVRSPFLELDLLELVSSLFFVGLRTLQYVGFDLLIHSIPSLARLLLLPSPPSLPTEPPALHPHRGPSVPSSALNPLTHEDRHHPTSSSRSSHPRDACGGRAGNLRRSSRRSLGSIRHQGRSLDQAGVSYRRNASQGVAGG